MIGKNVKHGSHEKKNEVDFEKKVNLDGSTAEIITDHRNKRVEICEYDARGDNVVRVYGVFEAISEISDDEIDSYIDMLNSKYK